MLTDEQNMYDNERIRRDPLFLMPAIPLTFRASPEFATQVDEFARKLGLSRSDYVRAALEEKNARALSERVRFLSRTLSSENGGIGEELDGASGDGLADH